MSDQPPPIREPEISREALIKVLADHFGFRPYEQMAEDKSDLRGKVRDGYDVNEPTKSDLAEATDAILNLAPVGGRGEEGSSRADLSPASRSPEPAPHWIDGRRFSEHAGERWRHVKRGSVYSLPFGRAEAMVQCAEPLTDESVLTIYIGEDGMIFARPTHEFHDGRFVLLPDEHGLSGAQRSELSTQLRDEQNPSHNEESQTNGS